MFPRVAHVRGQAWSSGVSCVRARECRQEVVARRRSRWAIKPLLSVVRVEPSETMKYTADIRSSVRPRRSTPIILTTSEKCVCERDQTSQYKIF